VSWRVVRTRDAGSLENLPSISYLPAGRTRAVHFTQRDELSSCSGAVISPQRALFPRIVGIPDNRRNTLRLGRVCGETSKLWDRRKSLVKRELCIS
jgi:hypothetical protein